MLVVGDVVTMDQDRPRAQAMAIFEGTILAVGSESDAAAALPSGYTRHKAPGTVVPGLIDSHLHMQWAGLMHLERYGERPVPLDEALEAFAAAPAQDTYVIEGTRPEERLAALRVIQPIVHALGITGVVDPALRTPELSTYIESHRRGELKTRVVGMPWPDLPSGARGAIAGLDALGVRTGLGDDWFRLGGVKAFFDGIGMAATALRREPWPGREGDADGRGWQRVETEEFYALAQYCAETGWSLGVHTVGGGAIDAVLDVFARVDARTPIRDLGFTLIHAYLEPSEDNLRQAGELGVLVAAQPAIHWKNGKGLREKLGSVAEGANPIAGWLSAGVTVGGGSDGPGFPFDPRLGLWQARTRHVAGEAEPHAPELGVDAAAALALYTIGAAAVSLDDRRRGRLRAGFLADWTALSVDPLTAAPEEVRHMSVLETVVGGHIVHQAQG